ARAEVDLAEVLEDRGAEPAQELARGLRAVDLRDRPEAVRVELEDGERATVPLRPRDLLVEPPREVRVRRRRRERVPIPVAPSRARARARTAVPRPGAVPDRPQQPPGRRLDPPHRRVVEEALAHRPPQVEPDVLHELDRAAEVAGARAGGGPGRPRRAGGGGGRAGPAPDG